MNIQTKRQTVTASYVLALLLLTSISNASEGDSGQQSILSHGVGVRALGMGGAYITLADDADATTWNPALLTYLSRQSFSGTYVSLFEGTTLNSAAWGAYFDKIGGIGVSFSRLGTDEFPAVVNWIPQADQISYSTSLATVSYAYRQSERLSLGISGKALYESVYNSNDFGFGLDVAGVYSYDKWRAGIVVRDLISPKLTLSSESVSSPLSIQLGLSASNWKISSALSGTIAADLEIIEDQSAGLHIGAESVISDVIALRFGFTREDPTFGVGFYFDNFRLDYAYRALDNLEDSHRFGLSLSFGKTVKQKMLAAQEYHEALGRSFAAADRTARAGAAFTRATEFDEAGEIDSSAFYYKMAINLDSTVAGAADRLALVETAIAEREAARAFSSVSGIDSLALVELASSLSIQLASRLTEQNRYRAALDILESALEADGEDSSLLATKEEILNLRNGWKTNQRNTARGAERAGDYAMAIGLYADMLREFPSDKYLRVAVDDLGSRLKVSDLLEGARERFNNKELNDALDMSESALAIEPENMNAHALLDEIKRALSSHSDLDVISDNPADWQAMSQALDFVRQGKLQEALSLLEGLLEKYPDNQELLRNKQQVELRLTGGE